MRMIKLPMAVFTLLLGISAGIAADDKFVVPENDLPEALVHGRRVAFTRNGAVVVAKEERWLFDLGLNYATPGWQEWGTQIRRSDVKDMWQADPQTPDLLTTRGSLFSINSDKRFQFSQQSRIVPGGLQLNYDIVPLTKQTLEGFGLVCHLPVAETPKAKVVMWPGFSEVVLPEQNDDAVLANVTARAAVLYVSGKPRCAFIGRRGMAWSVYDDRKWRLNLFRIVARDPALLEPLNRGESARFSAELLLGEAAVHTIPLERGHCEVDRYGRLALFTPTGKLLEGGVASGGSSVQWLYETAEPASEMNDTLPVEPFQAHGKGVLGEKAVTYDVEAAEEETTVKTTFRFRGVLDAQERDSIKATFAIPQVRLVGPPEPALLNKPKDEAMAAEESVFGHAMTATSEQGVILTLESQTPWELQTLDVEGTPCFVLTAEARRGEDGDYETSVRFSMLQGEETGEEHP